MESSGKVKWFGNSVVNNLDRSEVYHKATVHACMMNTVVARPIIRAAKELFRFETSVLPSCVVKKMIRSTRHMNAKFDT